MEQKALEVTIQMHERTWYIKTVHMTQAEFDALDNLSDEDIMHKYIDRLDDWTGSDSEECWDISVKPIEKEQP